MQFTLMLFPVTPRGFWKIPKITRNLCLGKDPRGEGPSPQSWQTANSCWVNPVPQSAWRITCPTSIQIKDTSLREQTVNTETPARRFNICTGLGRGRTESDTTEATQQQQQQEVGSQNLGKKVLTISNGRGLKACQVW